MDALTKRLIGKKLPDLVRCDQHFCIGDEITHIDTVINFGEGLDRLTNTDIGAISPFHRILQDYENDRGLRGEIYVPQPTYKLIDIANQISVDVAQYVRDKYWSAVLVYDFGKSQRAPLAMILPSISKKRDDGEWSQQVYENAAMMGKLTWVGHCEHYVKTIRTKVNSGDYSRMNPHQMTGAEMRDAINDDRGWSLIAGHRKVAFENVVVLGVVLRKPEAA